MNAELMSIDWIGRGWLLILAFTAAVLLVFALRKPFRYLFGTELAFQLWWLPPLAMVASQWTHAAHVSAITFSPAVLTMTSAVAALPARATESGVTEWRAWIAWFWISGGLVSVVSAMLGQWRYRRHLRGATLVKGAHPRWPVLRAASADIGPALIGAWRAHIVLPIDFESRYDANEQSLILAHETVHARRRDGWWCLVARIVSAALWFHPLAWLAMLALRRDQELACDAVVLRELGVSPRSYANAMLKTQCAALALPVGCPWSRHPITERIAMLKLKQPDLKRRRIGGVLMTMSALGFTCAVYAATPSTQPRIASIVADHYTLKINVAMGGRTGSKTSSYCVSPNEYVDVDGDESDKFSWKGKFSVTPVAAGQIEIRSQVYTRFDRGAGRVREQRATPIVRTMPGQEATVVFGQIVDGKHLEKLEDNTIKIAMTPSPGCQDTPSAPGVNSTKSPMLDPSGPASTVVEYQLNTSIELATASAGGENVRRAALSLCTANGKTTTFKVHDWLLRATAISDGADRLHVDLVASDANHRSLAQASLHGSMNQILHADGTSADGKSRYVMEVTPLAGCPARLAAVVEDTSRS